MAVENKLQNILQDWTNGLLLMAVENAVTVVENVTIAVENAA